MKLCLSCEATFSGVSWVCPECSWSPAQNGVTRFAPDLADSSEYLSGDAVMRVERGLIRRGVSFPVGSSLVVVGRKR